MMLAQEASIIDIIGVPFLLPKPSGAVLVFEAVLAGAPRRACVQNGASRMLMMLSRRAAWNAQKPSLCWGFPTKTRVFGTLALRCPEAAGEKRRSHEARSAALCARPLLLRSRPFMARALAGHQKGRALMAAASAANPPQTEIGQRPTLLPPATALALLWGKRPCRRPRFIGPPFLPGRSWGHPASGDAFLQEIPTTGEDFQCPGRPPEKHHEHRFAQHPLSKIQRADVRLLGGYLRQE